MNDVKVFIITHKECELPKMDDYYSLLVGASKNETSQQFDFYDNTGVNISRKNPNYCELTGLYWIWKNVDANIVGLCHYRRYFSIARISTSQKYYLSTKRIKEIMQKNDIILPKRLYYRKNIMNSVRVAPNLEDLKEMRTAIEVLFPDYLDEYDFFLKQRSCYLFNMCIMKKQQFDEYCEWIFAVLNYIEMHHDMSKESSYRSRLFGFLSERLIWVWMKHNIPENRIKEVRVVRTDVGGLTQFFKEIKNAIKKIAAKFNIF